MLHASAFASWFQWCSWPLLRGRRTLDSHRERPSPFCPCWLDLSDPYQLSFDKNHVLVQFSGNRSIFSFDFGPIWDWFLIRNFQNSNRTPLVFDKEWVVPVLNLSHWEKPLSQAQPVPVGQVDWDRLCLSQWDRLCLSQTCPTGTGKGQKRPVLVPWTSHIPTLEARPLLVAGQALWPQWNLFQSNLSQLVPQSGTTRPWKSRRSSFPSLNNEFATLSFGGTE